MVFWYRPIYTYFISNSYTIYSLKMALAVMSLSFSLSPKHSSLVLSLSLPWKCWKKWLVKGPKTVINILLYMCVYASNLRPIYTRRPIHYYIRIFSSSLDLCMHFMRLKFFTLFIYIYIIKISSGLSKKSRKKWRLWVTVKTKERKRGKERAKK